MKTTRRTLGVLLAAAATASAHDEYEHSVSRTMAIHGIPAPFAVAGYLMGEHALTALGLERFSPEVEVTHHSPATPLWTSVADGLQAATGASLGKLNLKHAIEAKETYAVIRNRKTGRQVRLALDSAFVAKYAGLTPDKLFQAGLDVAELKPAGVFRIL
jgi:formylmethanofuran dehydrogenase subunit E